MNKLPDMICTPCPPTTMVAGDASFLDEDGKLPKEICCDPVPTAQVVSQFNQPIVISTDCFSDMLKNMTSKKFCAIGPGACS